MMPSPSEPLTDDLLKELLAGPTADSFCSSYDSIDISLPDYLARMIEDKGLRKIDVIHAAALNETFGYQIFNGERRPSRNKVLQLAFGLHCTVPETQHLLIHAGLSELYCKNRRDAIILFCLDRSCDLGTADAELYRFGEPTIQDGA